MSEEKVKTRVLGINISDDAQSLLEKEGMEVFRGTYGPFVDTRSLKHDWDYLPVKGEWNLPTNLQEYSVIIEDMKHLCSKEYKYDENDTDAIVVSVHNWIKPLGLCKPMTIFDPTPFGCSLINDYLKCKKGKIIKIAFQKKKYSADYFGQSIIGWSTEKVATYSNYAYLDDFCSLALTGDKVKLADSKILKVLFDGLTTDISYEQTYYHPKVYKDNKQIEDDNFVPILYNQQGDIISYFYFKGFSLTIILHRASYANSEVFFSI